MSKENECEGRVLFVDDEASIREALSELLVACGFDVQTADSYDSAVRVLENDENIEAIVCDLKMPGKSGVEVLRYVNRKKRNIPVIFLTGYGTFETCQDAVKEGAFDYILKPIDNKDKIVFPLRHAVEKTRLEKRNKEMQRDIIRMAEEHQKILDGLLTDVELKDEVQSRISAILDKWQ